MTTLSLADARDRRLVKSLRSMVSAGLDCLAILEGKGDDDVLRAGHAAERSLRRPRLSVVAAGRAALDVRRIV
jgi:hypothetical protein